MGRCISMLRGINVGSQKRVNMQSLTSIFESLGFSNIQTYIQSGNVVFDHKYKDASKLKPVLEAALKKTLGFEIIATQRSTEEMAKVVKSNPFSNKDLSRVHVTFLSNEPNELPFDSIKSASASGEKLFHSKMEIYLYLPNGYGTTKLSNRFFEKKLGVSATTRSWNTVNTLLEMSSSPG